MLKLSSGAWCSVDNVLKTEAVNYFSNLYAHDGVTYNDVNLRAQAQVQGSFNWSFGHLWTCFKAKTTRDRVGLS